MRGCGLSFGKGWMMTECTVCGREYPSALGAALCGETDLTEEEDRRLSVFYRSSD